MIAECCLLTIVSNRFCCIFLHIIRTDNDIHSLSHTHAHIYFFKQVVLKTDQVNYITFVINVSVGILVSHYLAKGIDKFYIFIIETI